MQAGLAVFWDANRLQTVVTAIVQQHLPLTVKELQVTPAALSSHLARHQALRTSVPHWAMYGRAFARVIMPQETVEGRTCMWVPARGQGTQSSYGTESQAYAHPST